MRRIAVALCTVTGTLVGVAAPTGAAPPPPYPDADNVDAANPYGWFEAGLEWRGDFPDPHVVVVDGFYVAYSTTAGGRYLPMTVSTDLVHWYAHPRWTTSPWPYPVGDPKSDPAIPIEIRQSTMSPLDTWNMNDALVAPAPWALRHSQGPWLKKDVWAPGVIQIGSTWFAYSAVKVSNVSDDPNGLGRWCLTVAAAPSFFGPFRDISGGGPVWCDLDPAGSLDPSPFYDPVKGKHYLLWKAAGRVGNHPSKLKALRLRSDGRPVARAPRTLLKTKEGSWEGTTIENPSMLFWQGTYYLFYSGNSYRATPFGTSNYATGYAACPKGPRDRCHRLTGGPLLASAGHEQGPGGASAFVDLGGGARLAYAYYWLGENRASSPVAHPRRMKAVRLTRNPDGTLNVS